MKICQTLNTHHTEDDVRDRSLVARAQSFAREGHEVQLVSPVNAPAGLHEREPRFVRRFVGAAEPTEPSESKFDAEIVHAHEPFLAGEEALRLSDRFQAPLVFTAGFRPKKLLPLSPAEADAMDAFLDKLEVCYANHCDLVIAPSSELAVKLFENGVARPIHVVPDSVAAADTDEPAAPSESSRRLLEIYQEAIHQRRARGRAAEVGHMARLRRELANAWRKIQPAREDASARPRGLFSPVGDENALPC